MVNKRTHKKLWVRIRMHPKSKGRLGQLFSWLCLGRLHVVLGSVVPFTNRALGNNPYPDPLGASLVHVRKRSFKGDRNRPAMACGYGRERNAPSSNINHKQKGSNIKEVLYLHSNNDLILNHGIYTIAQLSAISDSMIYTRNLSVDCFGRRDGDCYESPLT